MNDVSLFRLYLLRAMYLLISVGLAIFVMPGFFHREKPWELYEVVVQCMLAAFWALSILGLRYPLQMLPILLWELVWKLTWLIVVALPLWRTNQMNESTAAMASSILWVVIIPFVIPWHYMFKNYVQKSGERWK